MNTFAITHLNDAWHTIALNGDAPAHSSPAPIHAGDDHESASTLADVLAAQPAFRGSAILGLPTAWCMAATIPLDDLPTRGRTQAMHYRLEERLMLPSEDCVSRFLALGDSAFAVTVERQLLDRITAVFNTPNLRLHACIPTSLLLISAVTRQYPNISAVVVLGETTEIITLAESKPSAWHVSPAHIDDIIGALPPDSTTTPSSVLVIQADAPRPELIAQLKPCLPDGAIVLSDRPAIEWVNDGARQVAKSHRATPLNFATSDEAPRATRRAWTAAGVASGILAASVIATSLVSLSASYHQEQLATDRQIAAFRSAFPQQPIPVNIRARLKSSVAASAGDGLPESAGSSRATPTMLMARSLQALARSPLCRLLDARATPARLTIEGQARSHADADGLASTLRTSAAELAVDIDPAQTDALPDRGVSFIITGSPAISARPTTTPGARP